MNNEKREQQIKEAARQRADKYDHPSKWSDTYYGFIDGAKWADFHPQWIPVEERKPNDGQVVFIYTKHGSVSSVTYKDGAFNLNEVLEVINVTHWMPLPTPPQGKEEKNDK